MKTINYNYSSNIIDMIIYIIAIILIFSSCDTKLDPIKFKDQNPIFNINKGLNSWNTEDEFSSYFSDSVKVNHDYIIEYKLEDESSILTTEIKNSHLGVFKLENQDLRNIEGLPTGQNSIVLNSSNIGTHNFGYKVLDNYGQLNEVNFDITVFYNLKPTASFNIYENSINQPYQYIIDASSSFDNDAKFGGGIMQYQLIVNNDTRTSFSPIFNYYFAAPGNYTIGVRVLDNDNEWGTLKQISYNVN